MTVLLVLMTVFFFVLLNDIVRRRAEAAAVPTVIPGGLNLARNHVWLSEQGEGKVRIGIDHFLSRLVGQPNAVVLPVRESPVDHRARAMTLRFGDLSLALAIPVTGYVVSVNRKAVNDPSIVRDDPYGKGWLLEIRRDTRRDRSGSFLMAEPSRWLSKQVERAVNFFMKKDGSVALATAQDGGLLIEGLVWQYGDDVRDEFVRQFASLDQE